VILDNDSDEVSAGDEAQGASADVDTGRIQQVEGVHNTSATSELALAPTESIDVPARGMTLERAASLRSQPGTWVLRAVRRAFSCTSPASAAPPIL
jgi:hypothetical protein